MRSLFAALFFLALALQAQTLVAPHTITVDPSMLAALKAAYERAPKSAAAYDVRRTLHTAERALAMKPLAVTMKTSAPEGGTTHDYVSLAPYWWPDPASPTGLPYIRRDGEVNPERERYQDREHFRTLVPAVDALARAYYFTGREHYAKKAAELIAVWFLDTATAMTPRLDYAQAIRGLNTGRGAGLIEMHMLPRVLDATILLEGSKTWTPARQQAMKNWASRYYTWLTTSATGLDEADAPNNHGSWYEVQRTSLALYTGRSEEAKQFLEEAKTRRIASEIEPDGGQPKEFVRTKALHYSTYNLTALATLASIGSRVGVDLWQYESGDGRSIKRAIDYMAPFYAGEKKWDRQQIEPFDWDEALEVLRMASPQYDGAYDGIIRRLLAQKNLPPTPAAHP